MNAAAIAPRPAQGLDLPRPYLLFLGDADDTGFLKTGLGLRDWAPDLCVAEYKCDGARASLGLPVLRPADAYRAGARALVLSVASIGGAIAPPWIPYIVEALEAGLDIISGAHDRLAEEPCLRAAAERLGRRLIDVRVPPPGLPIASGKPRTGKRLLTVGTDCALGKKYTALALAAAFRGRGLAADFRATGQTGIMIAGSGIPIDSVVSDFVAGAAEKLSPDADPGHWDVIEGQGSIFHPSYAGVSLGLLHGSQPDILVLCHAHGRDRIMGLPDYPLPSIGEAVDLSLQLARRTNAAVRCAGVSLNTAGLSADEAEALIARRSREWQLPVADPMRGGPSFERLVDACLG
ncbi:DUF1611 domain-containing protein [Rhizorhabdus histidinilytica]|uniref:Uncharacterized conserved protein, NAD-dependent epimerase/dehydratase family n=1 Tax=Rhizorhabdus histidinilytica TaxID=439228 RepID=A0A1T5GNF9_9SPHN|nr:DUF1611 domain-containing protein [Rhizorhabdus histidinilytica]SKC09962.1 Uncharacterized conserved protein, NAD-dependent epimerase/dehydratase family [Rhizorhabdus histidinilytica]